MLPTNRLDWHTIPPPVGRLHLTYI